VRFRLGRARPGNSRGVDMDLAVFEAATARKNRRVCLGGALGSGSLAFPALLLGLGPLPAWPPRSSRVRRLPGGKPPRIGRRALWSPLQSARTWAGAPRDPPLPACEQTRWSRSWAPPLLGFVRLYPFAERPSAHPLPPDPGRSGRRNAPVRRDGLGFGPTVPPVDIRFRPRGFSPPRRFSPRGGCEFVAPRCRPWGSPRFPLPRSRSPEGGREAVGAFPAVRFTPFEEFPSSTAAPHHCDPCRPAVAACAERVAPPATPVAGRHSQCRPGEQPASRPCSADESVATRRRFQRRAARSFHGLGSPSRSEHAPLQPGRAGKPTVAGEPARAGRRGASPRRVAAGAVPLASLWEFPTPPMRHAANRGAPDRAVPPESVRSVSSWSRGSASPCAAADRRSDRVAMLVPRGGLHRPSWGF